MLTIALVSVSVDRDVDSGRGKFKQISDKMVTIIRIFRGKYFGNILYFYYYSELTKPIMVVVGHVVMLTIYCKLKWFCSVSVYVHIMMLLRWRS